MVFSALSSLYLVLASIVIIGLTTGIRSIKKLKKEKTDTYTIESRIVQVLINLEDKGI